MAESTITGLPPDAVSGFVVRPALARDVDAIAHLWSDLVDHHRQLDVELPPAAPNGPMRYARRILDHLDDPMARVLVAESNGLVIGYVLGVIVDLAPEMFQQEASGFLADIYVDADHRRRGAGRNLVHALTDWFCTRGILYYEWHAAALNTEGIAFWRSLGGRDVMLRMRADVPRNGEARTTDPETDGTPA